MIKYPKMAKFVPIFFPIAFSIIFTLPLACENSKKTDLYTDDNFSIPCKSYAEIGLAPEKLKPVTRPRKQKVTAIILHSTNWLGTKKYLNLSLEENMLVHLVIDKKANIYGYKKPQQVVLDAAPSMDEETIHISLEGTPGQILKNKKQLLSAQSVIKKIADHFQIPLSNYDINSKQGIFTHTQSKIKYGGFIRIYPEDGGEAVIRELLSRLKGKYYPESKWKDRYTKNWVYRKENRNLIKSRGKLTLGQGITPAPKSPLKIVEKDKHGSLPEKYRIKYIDRGLIEPRCITLHFSGSRSFFSTKNDLEKRRLASTFIAGAKGQIYQVMDKLEHKAAAATGTNKHCMQIEIVGTSEDDLLRNKVQTKKVALLLKELSEKFDFPLNNLDIDSHKGVFSHGQAKKRYGQSVWIMGDDFDPGEKYMKQVIELSGGKYFPEKDWKDRKSLQWKILFRKFQP